MKKIEKFKTPPPISMNGSSKKPKLSFEKYFTDLKNKLSFDQKNQIVDILNCYDNYSKGKDKKSCELARDCLSLYLIDLNISSLNTSEEIQNFVNFLTHDSTSSQFIQEGLSSLTQESEYFPKIQAPENIVDLQNILSGQATSRFIEIFKITLDSNDHEKIKFVCDILMEDSERVIKLYDEKDDSVLKLCEVIFAHWRQLDKEEDLHIVPMKILNQIINNQSLDKQIKITVLGKIFNFITLNHQILKHIELIREPIIQMTYPIELNRYDYNVEDEEELSENKEDFSEEEEAYTREVLIQLSKIIDNFIEPSSNNINFTFIQKVIRSMIYHKDRSEHLSSLANIFFKSKPIIKESDQIRPELQSSLRTVFNIMINRIDQGMLTSDQISPELQLFISGIFIDFYFANIKIIYPDVASILKNNDTLLDLLDSIEHQKFGTNQNNFLRLINLICFIIPSFSDCPDGTNKDGYQIMLADIFTPFIMTVLQNKLGTREEVLKAISKFLSANVEALKDDGLDRIKNNIKDSYLPEQIKNEALPEFRALQEQMNKVEPLDKDMLLHIDQAIFVLSEIVRVLEIQ